MRLSQEVVPVNHILLWQNKEYCYSLVPNLDSRYMFAQFGICKPQFSINMSLLQPYKGNILIINEITDYLDILFKTLTDSGFNVTISACMEAAYQVEVSRPDLIILDVTAPRTKAVEICRQLKEKVTTRDIPIILITNVAQTEQKIKCFQFGAVDQIATPLQPEDILVRVRNQMTIRQLQNKLREQEQRLQHQMALQNIIGMMQERICQSFKLEEILSTTVKEVRQFLETDRVLIYQFQDNCSRVVALDSLNPNPISKLETTIILPQNRESNITSRNQFRDYLPLHLQAKPNLILPIKQGQQLWGLLVVENYSKTREWQELEIELIEQLVRQVGIIIQQAEIYQKLETVNEELHRLATLDSLTQLANRYRFNVYLNQEWRRSAREQYEESEFGEDRHLSLIMCDVDFFKLYNDTYGHLAGDICLQQVAEAIRATVNRSTDLVARYGGEEFAVILPNTNAEDAFYIAEQIRSKIKALQIPHVKSRIGEYVTLSLGVSTSVPSQQSSPEALIAAADKALYQAKEQGRDRTHILNSI